MLECICVSLVVLKDLNLFIKHGLSSKLVAYLADLDQNHLMGAAVALGSIACKGPAELLKFLISLKDTQGLKNYWKCMQLEEDFGGNERLHAGLSNFVNSVGSLIFLDRYDCAEVNIVIDSGYAHALAGCLKNDCRQAFKINAITMLGSICASPELPSSKREVIVQLDILPEAVEYMKSANPQAMASAAMLVTRLVDNSLERRDKAIELGAMTILLGNIRKHFANPMIIYNSMIAVEGLLKVCPSLPIEVFKSVLVTITDIFHMVFTPRFDLMTIAVDCLREFIGYGRAGVDAILKTPRLANKIIAYLYSSTSDLQAASVVLLRELCETGNSEHRRQFLELGALDNFTSILQVESNETRQWALECLLILLQEDLTCGQKQAVQRLRDLVKAEICKKIPETYESARAVYSKMI